MRYRFLAVALSIVVAGALPCRASEDAKKDLPKTSQAWTLDEARHAVQFEPDDAYLQYVALQLASQEAKTAEVTGEIESLHGRWFGRPDNRQPDLFDMFTGALAVQEGLQLDAFRQPTGQPGNMLPGTWSGDVEVSGLAGSLVRSHPWGKMLAAQTLAGKKPEVSPLSLCVPEDQYFVEFRSLSKLLEVAEAGNLWGDHLFIQGAKTAQSQGASQRLKDQLAMKTDPLSRLFYDTVVEEVALTGNDLFFREGTDITMLFTLKQPAVFRLRMDGYLDEAAKSRPDAVRSTGTILGVDYVEVATPDRAISALSAYPRPNLHVRSNSKAALARVLAAIDGKQDTPRLGESTEFKYIRTLMPRGDAREDGFVYLSDPFIRRIVGPEQKLTEGRRLICYNNLRMIGHAAMLYRTQYGKQAKSLDELVEARCLPPSFGRAGAAGGNGLLVCPDGGTYALSDDGTTGVCSHHGHCRQLVPCLEIPVRRVTAWEASQYKQFLVQYNNYWRRYFDPIAVRIQVTPKQYRAETIVLPLIDNSIYSSLAQTLGGEPEQLDKLPVPKRNIFSVVLRLNKEALFRHPLFNMYGPSAGGPVSEATAREFLSKGIGNQVGLHVYDGEPMFDLNLSGFFGDLMDMFHNGPGRVGEETFGIAFLGASLNSPVYAAVPVKDAKVVDKFFSELDAGQARLARRHEGGGFLPLQHDFYKVPLPGSDQRIRCYGVSVGALKWRVFFARIGQGLYLASKRCILEDLLALKDQPGPGGAEAHAMVRIRADHWHAVLPDYRLGWEENSRQACLGNLGPLSNVARAMAAGGTAPPTPAAVLREAERLYATHFYCPDGGRYEVSADGKEVTCSVHGSAALPKQLAAPTAESCTARWLQHFGGATAELTFLEDGLHAVVTIQRK